MLASLSTDYFNKNHTEMKGLVTNRDVISRSEFGGTYTVIKGELNGNPVIEIHQTNWLGNDSDLYTESQYRAMNQSLDAAIAPLAK